MVLKVRLSVTILMAAAVSSLPILGEDSSRVRLVDAQVDTSRLRPFEARWRSLTVAGGQERQLAVVDETMRLTELHGRKAWLHEQVFKPSQGEKLITRYYFDAQTLAVLRYEGPPEAQDFDWSPLENYRSRSFSTSEPMFEALRLELLLQSLPLDEGYRIQVPTRTYPSGSGQPPSYWLTVRVTGSGTFDPGDGSRLDVWEVATDWEQVPEAGVLFLGNALGGSGGGTWRIIKNPPPGAHSLASVSYVSPGSISLIEMRDGLHPRGGSQ